MTCARGHRPRQRGHAEPSARQTPCSPSRGNSRPAGTPRTWAADFRISQVFTPSHGGKTRIILGPVLSKVLPSNTSMIVREVSDF